MRRKCRERFPCHRLERKSQVRDHARAVMHIGIANTQWWKNVPGIPGACTTRNFTHLARGPCSGLTRYIHVFSTSFHISCLIKHHTNTLTQLIHYQSVYGHENTQCWGHRLISNIVHTHVTNRTWQRDICATNITNIKDTRSNMKIDIIYLYDPCDFVCF